MRRNIRRQGEQPRYRLPRGRAFLGFLLAGMVPAFGQTAGEASAQAAAASAQPLTITLEEAIRRAEANEPSYAQASAESRTAGLDRSIARAGLLPKAALSQPGALYAGQRPTEPGRTGRGRAAFSEVHRQQCGPGVRQPGRGERDAGTGPGCGRSPRGCGGSSSRGGDGDCSPGPCDRGDRPVLRIDCGRQQAGGGGAGQAAKRRTLLG